MAVRSITVVLANTTLPAITTPMTIDGWSQGVNDGSPGYHGPPLIELIGAHGTRPAARV